MSEKRVFDGTMLTQGQAEKVRLVVEYRGQEFGDIYCVRSKSRQLFKRETDNEVRLWESMAHSLSGAAVGREGSAFAKRHFIDLEFAHWRNPVRVYMSPDDAKAVAELVGPWVVANNKRRDRANMVRIYWDYSMLSDFKAGSVIDLNDYVRRHASVLDDFTSELGSFAIDGGVSEARMSEEEKHTCRLLALVSKLKAAVSEGQLNGVVDERVNEYRDRAYIVQQQRMVNVSVDFNSLVAQLGNKGIVLQGIKCPECGGATSEVPTGSHFTCEYCRATVSAVDLFEEFRAVLGGR